VLVAISVAYNFYLGAIISLKSYLVAAENEVRHDFIKGLSIWRETDVPPTHKIEGFTDGFIPSIIDVAG
jgi:hypothetical protein